MGDTMYAQRGSALGSELPEKEIETVAKRLVNLAEQVADLRAEIEARGDRLFGSQPTPVEKAPPPPPAHSAMSSINLGLDRLQTAIDDLRHADERFRHFV